MVDQFLRLRDGDRFWYQNAADFKLSASDFKAIQSMSLSKLITLNTDIPSLPGSVLVVPKPNAFSFAGKVASEESSKSSGEAVLDEKMNLQWISDSETITFTIRTNYTGWFGIGFSNSGMDNADIIICASAGDKYTCDDYYSQSSQPVLDTQIGGKNDLSNVVDTTSAEPWHTRVVSFSRKLDTKDGRDNPIKGGKVGVIYAFSDSKTIAYHGPSNRGQSLLPLSGAGASDDYGHLEYSQRLYFIVHGSIMVISFFVLAPVAIFVARHPQLYDKWLSRHETLMSKIVDLAVTDIIIVAISGYIRGKDYTSFPHARIGFTMCALLVLNRILGFIAKKVDVNRSFSKYTRKIHQVCGWLTFLLGMANCCYGIKDILVDVDDSLIAPLSLMSVALLTLSLILVFDKYIIAYLTRHTKGLKFGKAASTTLALQKVLPKFDWDEIHYRIEKGAHWIVLDDMIYDVEEFRSHHPGGHDILVYVYGLNSSDIYNGRKSVTMYVDGKDPETGKSIKRMIKKKYSHSR